MTGEKNSTTLKDYQTTITILEHLSEAIFILTPNGTIQYANRVATDLLGLPLASILNKNLNEFLDPAFQFEQDEKNFLEQIYQNGVLQIESTLKSGDYSTPVDINFGFVRNTQDEVDYIIASAHDVSLKKSLEKELYQQQLYFQSRDRYRELGELAINIVHRLSQPITTIRLLVEMMQKQLNTSQINTDNFKKNFGQILSLLNQMNTVISNVRNFAFLTENENLKQIDLWNLLQHSIEHLHYEITENNFEIFINKDAQLPPVFADPLNIQQTFATLIRFYLNHSLKRKHDLQQELQIDLRNVDDRWIEVLFYNNNALKRDWQQVKQKQNHTFEQNFNLAVVQLMVTSSGGDFKHWQKNKNLHLFLLRFPAAHSNDRQQLLNMIDLMK